MATTLSSTTLSVLRVKHRDFARELTARVAELNAGEATGQRDADIRNHITSLTPRCEDIAADLLATGTCKPWDLRSDYLIGSYACPADYLPLAIRP